MLKKTNKQQQKGSQPAPKAKGAGSGGIRRKRGNGGESMPVSIGYRRDGRAAEIGARKGGVITVHHQEFVTDVNLYSSAEPAGWSSGLITLRVNPGLGATFPWLAAIAPSFSFYRFRSCKFEFVPAGPSTLAGEILMAFDPDASNSPPASKAAMLNFAHSTRSSPFQANVLAVPQSALNSGVRGGFRPVRGGNLSVPNLNRPTFDAGTFYFKATGPVAFSPCGDIRLTYDIELKEPQSVDPSSSFVVVSALPSRTAGYLLGQSAINTTGGLTYVTLPGTVVEHTVLSLPVGHYYFWAAWLGPLIGVSCDAHGQARLLSSNFTCVNAGSGWINQEFLVDSAAEPSGIDLFLPGAPAITLVYWTLVQSPQ